MVTMQRAKNTIQKTAQAVFYISEDLLQFRSFHPKVFVLPYIRLLSEFDLNSGGIYF